MEYPLENITHVFFHSLIVNTSLAFDGDSDEAGYNQMMTTVSEFKKMLQIMYDKGYVLVSPHDMAVINDDGTMSRGKIMLPEGKILLFFQRMTSATIIIWTETDLPQSW